MTVIKGKRIYLKELQVKDITKDYVDWMNDPEVNRFLESRHSKQTMEGVKSYVRSFVGKKNKLLFGIFDNKTKLHLGNISFSEINRYHRYGAVGIAVGRKSFWGKGVGTEAIKLIVKYGFGTLKLKRIEAGAYADNAGSIKIFKKAGFRIEAVLKKKYRSGNRFVDGVLMEKSCK